jgi:hypothetical protein
MEYFNINTNKITFIINKKILVWRGSILGPLLFCTFILIIYLNININIINILYKYLSYFLPKNWIKKYSIFLVFTE